MNVIIAFLHILELTLMFLRMLLRLNRTAPYTGTLVCELALKKERLSEAQGRQFLHLKFSSEMTNPPSNFLV